MAKNNQKKRPEKEESGWKFWLQTILLTIVLYAIIMLAFKFTLANERVSGPSMQPTFEDGQKLLAVKHTNIQRGDVIILKAPDEAGSFYIKRVIGMPGDTIVSKNNKMYINGKRYKESFLDAGNKIKEKSPNVYAGKGYSWTYNFTLSQLAQSPEYQQIYSKSYLNKVKKTNKVPAGTYFVMGDHRTVSKDSRLIGFIKKSSVVGEVKWRYWPLNEWTVF